MNRLTASVLALLAFVATVVGCATPGGPPGTGWTTLIDGTAANLENFHRVGAQANWRAEDGVIVADKGSGKGTSHLVTKSSYRDLQIWAEFWADHTTNSGIFIRITDPKNPGSANSYEVNIFDQRKDPTYGTGAIVNFAKVDPMPKAGGRWNTFLITAKGPSITVEMNGKQTASISNDQFREGPISLQYGPAEGGAIKWRRVMVRPL